MFYGAGGIGEAAQAVRLKVSASFYCRNLHKMSRLGRIQRQFVHVCVLKGGAGGALWQRREHPCLVTNKHQMRAFVP